MLHDADLKKYIRILTGLILTVIVSFAAVIPVRADEAVSTGIVTNNIHDNDYTARKSVPNCYVCDNKNGTFSRVENMGDIILVETYNSSFAVIEQRFLNMELPVFGGFYSGSVYNYVLFGRENPGKNNGLEVLRLVKYSKSWVRLGGCAVTGCNTVIPFAGCNSDFSEYGNVVYARFGHTDYSGTQSVMTLAVRQSDMAFLQIQSSPAIESGAFADVAATYIDASDGKITAVDHSLTWPRGLITSRYTTAAGGSSFISPCAEAAAMWLPGTGGKATPGTSIGGYELSGQFRLVAGVTVPADLSSPNRNVFVAAIPKNADLTEYVRIKYATGFAYGDLPNAMTPFIVKIHSECFMLVWEARDGYIDTETVHYCFIDGSGQLTSEVKSIKGCLSDCQPILFNGRVIWYTTDGRSAKIYGISAVHTTVAPSEESREAIIYNGVNYSRIFDYGYYLRRYPDMRVLYSNDPAAALKHFVTVGMSEGRQGCENFDPQAYRLNYPDLDKAYGNNWRAYYAHFMNTGAAEGRSGRR